MRSQRLQRRIANARGIDPSISLSSIKSTPEESKHDGAHKKREPPSHGGELIIVPKRKYRRHPKVNCVKKPLLERMNMLTSVISPMRMHLNDPCPHMCFSLIVSLRYCAPLLSVRHTRTQMLIDYRRVEGKFERGPQSFVH